MRCALLVVAVLCGASALKVTDAPGGDTNGMMQQLMSMYSQAGGAQPQADPTAMMQNLVQNMQANGGSPDLQKMMSAMMSGTKPVDPSNPGKPMKPDSASMMMPLLMMPLVMGMGGGQGAERRAWAQPPRWWFQPPWWWNQPPWWFNQEPLWAANAEEEQAAL